MKNAIKASPTLKQEFRAANKFRKHYSGRILARPVMWILLAVAVRNIIDATGHPFPGWR